MKDLIKTIEQLRDTLPMMHKMGSLDDASNGVIHDSLNEVITKLKNLGVIDNVSETLTVKEVLEILDDSDHLDDARMLISEASSR